MFLLFLALLIDWFVGEPEALWKRVPHPVVLIGKLIDRADAARLAFTLPRTWSMTRERFDFFAGTALVVAMGVASLLISLTLHRIAGPLWWVVDLALVAILVAQKSLKDHVLAVQTALEGGGVEEGRRAVSMIVGRDVSTLDESGVTRAALESLAENFSDGITAPVLWYAVLGLPGILFYKAVNTADSMIGHRTPRHEFFGKAAARTDDALNWPAARLTAALAVLAGLGLSKLRPAQIWKRVQRDAPHHASPNAGWPETAFAAVLEIRLGGPRRYGETVVEAAVLNGEGRGSLLASDLSRGIVLFRRCCVILMGFCLAAALLF